MSDQFYNMVATKSQRQAQGEWTTMNSAPPALIPQLNSFALRIVLHRLKVTFRDASGKDIQTVEANEGDDLLTLAHAYGIDLEGEILFIECRINGADESELIHFPPVTGACEGSVACSTCHVILTPEHYDLLPEPDDEENDMLDMAFGLTDT